MAASSSKDSYPSDLDTSDPELDESENSDTDFGDDYEEMVGDNSDSDLDENVMTKEKWIATCKIVCRHTKTDIEIDTYEEEFPKQYKDVMDLCQLALTHYQNTRAGETYEFVRLEKAKVWFNEGVEYTLTISAKNLKGDVETIEAVGLARQGDELKILSCHVLK